MQPTGSIFSGDVICERNVKALEEYLYRLINFEIASSSSWRDNKTRSLQIGGITRNAAISWLLNFELIFWLKVGLQPTLWHLYTFAVEGYSNTENQPFALNFSHVPNLGQYLTLKFKSFVLYDFGQGQTKTPPACRFSNSNWHFKVRKCIAN